MQTYTTLNQLHKTALRNIAIVLLGLELNPVDVMLKESGHRDILWLKTYPQVLEALGLQNHESGKASSDPYDYEVGNGDIYEENGQLFTIVAIAINHVDEREPYFWIDFIFMEDQTVRIEIGATEIHADYCDRLLGDILPGVQNWQVCTMADALVMLHKIKQDIEKDPKHYEQFL